MSWIALIYSEIFFRPVLNSLLFLTSILPWHDFGLAIILLTVVVKIIIFPLTHSMIKTQRAMKKIDPEIKRINKEIKNKEEQTRAIMELYKKHGVNPFSGFFALLIQLPLLIAMFQVSRGSLSFRHEDVYMFLSLPQHINTSFLGFLNLTEPSIILAALAGIAQFIQTKLSIPPISNTAPKKDMSAMMQSQMLYFFPVFIFILAIKIPGAAPLYWTSMNIFAIVHEAIVRRKAESAELLQNDRR